MKAAIRIGFTAMIALAIAIQVNAARRGGAPDGAATRLAEGLRSLSIHIDRTTADNVLVAYAPSCGEPIQATLSRNDGSNDEALDALRSPGGRVRYVYLGAVTAGRAPVAFMARWLLARAVFIAGLSSFAPPSDVAVVILPRACPDLVVLDWQVVSPWD